MRVKLGECVEQIRGVSYKPEDLHDSLDADSVVLLRANNIKDGQLNFDDVVYVDKTRVKNSQLLKRGDILVCASSGSKNLVGKAAYVEEDMTVTFGAFCKVVRPKINTPKYIAHYFQSPIYRQEISNLSSGANINNIRNEHIDELLITLPGEDIQIQIVDLLDEVSVLLALRKKQLSKLDELVKSRFIEMFGEPLTNSKGWKTECLFSVAPTKQIPFELSGKVWLLNLDAVESNTGTVLFKNIVSNNEVNASTVMFSTDNVLYSKLRPYLNKVVLPDDKGVATSELLPLYPDKTKLNRVYLCYWLRNDAFVKHISEKVAGAKMPRVSMDYFRSIDIELPPIDLQNQFAEFVEQNDKSKLEIKESLEKLETLKKSLMQKYFG